MSRSMLEGFREVWLCDFEFRAPPGERPDPACLVATEFRTGRTVRLWREELGGRPGPPYPIGPDALFVAYYASAELGCHLALGWPMPARILDLHAEFRLETAGPGSPHGYTILGALVHHGLDAMGAEEKRAIREQIQRGGPWSEVERRAILDYCESDVEALRRLMPAMLPAIDLPRALLRGRYMAAAARMEWAGIPIDVEALTRLRTNWDEIRDRLVAEVDREFGVYDGRSFRVERWEAWLARHGIDWPRRGSGALEQFSIECTG